MGVLAVVVVFAAIFEIYTVKGRQVFESIGNTIVTVVFLIYCSTEALSIGNHLNVRNIKFFWLGMFLVAAAALFLVRKKLRFQISENVLLFGRILLYGMFLVLIFTIDTIPNNYDSMTYHLPRIMHWLQNGNVQYYATNIGRQNFSPVLGEYISLHFYALGGRDSFMQLAQTMAYLMGGIVAAGIAETLDAGKKGKGLTLILFYSSPLMLSEAFTTQVDNIAALFLLLSVYYIILLIKDDLCNVERLVYCALCIGFAYLCKPTVCFGAAVFLIGLFIRKLSDGEKFGKLVKAVFIAVFPLLLLIIPVFIRNLSIYDNLFAGSEFSEIVIGTYKPDYVLVNILKNIFMNFSTPIDFINQFFVGFVQSIALMLGVDVNSAAISFGGSSWCINSAMVWHHDYGMNFLIVFLMVYSLACFFRRKRSEKTALDKLYAVCAFISFLCICCILKWQPWGNRIMLPFVALFCPFIGKEFSRERGKSVPLRKAGSFAIYGISVIMIIGTLKYNMRYLNDYLEDSYECYFASKPSDYQIYKQIIGIINQVEVKKIGIFTGIDTYEYPIWAGIEENPENIQIEHIMIEQDELKALEKNDFSPDMIIILSRKEFREKRELYYGTSYYNIVWQSAANPDFAIYFRVSNTLN